VWQESCRCLCFRAPFTIKQGKYWCACQAKHKNIYLSWNDAAASVLVSKKVVLENVILKIQLGKSSSMSKFLSMRHQSRILVWWFCCILNTMKHSKPNGIVISRRNAKVKNGINCSIIDDSYSSDFQSLK
jgi:hypothetical protein